MTTRFKQPLFVLGTTILMMQAVVLPAGMVYAETTLDKEEQEQVERPPMKNYLEVEQTSEPGFFFTQVRMQGTVEEPLKVTFFSDQEVSEARVFLPEEATLLKDHLPTGVSVEEGGQPNEWIVQSKRAQNTFVLPIVVEKAGNYGLTVEETTAQLEISEQEDGKLGILEESSEENKKEIVEDDSTNDLPDETQSTNGKETTSSESGISGATIEDPDYLPVVYLVKDSETGVLVASEIDPSYDIYLYPGTTMTRPNDGNNSLGNQALQLTSSRSGERGVELSAPLYSNTNYTMEVRGRLPNPSIGEISNFSPVRYGVKTGLIEIHDTGFTQSYSNRALRFTSNNRFSDYQTVPNEHTIFYFYNRSSNQGDFWVRTTYVRMTPNKPIISFVGDSYLDINLSEVIGKTHEQIVEEFSKDIEEKLKIIAVDSNNNNNIISSVDIESIEDPFEVVSRDSKEIKINIKVAKWGEIGLSNFIINIVDDTISPVDPSDPETEVDPENKPELPEDQGLLSIDFASTFNFGSQAISAQEATYYAKPQRLLNEDGTVNEDEERPNYIQISDRRSETDRNGWQLAVTQNGQFETQAEEPLLGARLSFTNQALATAQGGILPELQQTNPLTLVPGVKRVLVMAQGNEGAGTWIYRFGDQETAGQSIALTVPQGANPKAEQYKTSLTWELSAVPDNE